MLSPTFLAELAARPGVPAESAAKLLATVRQGFRVVRRPPLARVGAEPQTFDCEGLEALPGKLVPAASGSSDPVIAAGASGADAWQRFMREVLRRPTLDGHGMPSRCCTHYSRSYCNAFWSGEEAVFGDGDGLMLRPFVAAVDFIGHEFMHAVTQFTAGLAYEGEAGALNESMSDVFGVALRQWVAGADAPPDWRFAPAVVGPTAQELGWDCLRHVAQPDAASSMTKQPARYGDYVPGGEPHTNSGIPNRAFYMATQNLGTQSWQLPLRCWYEALVAAANRPGLRFAEFAALTVRMAAKASPTAAASVEAAWRAVDVPVAAAVPL